MGKVRVIVLSALMAVPTMLISAPEANASCYEYIEGRCLENDVCTAVGRITGQTPDCIE